MGAASSRDSRQRRSRKEKPPAGRGFAVDERAWTPDSANLPLDEQRVLFDDLTRCIATADPEIHRAVDRCLQHVPLGPGEQQREEGEQRSSAVLGGPVAAHCRHGVGRRSNTAGGIAGSRRYTRRPGRF